MAYERYDSRNCPNCKRQYSSSEKRKIVSSRFPAENSDFEKLVDSFVGFSSHQTFFTYVHCANCDLLFSPKYFSKDQLQILYGSMPDNTGGEALEHLVRTQSGYVKGLKSSANISSRWLDVGADIGLFAGALRDKMPDVVFDAIEPNESVHQELASRIGDSGKIYGSWPSADGPKYAGIAAIHVLDHLTDLHLELQEIHLRLQNGGQLLAVVHNEKSLLRYLMGKKWPPFCLQHPQIFSPKTLREVLENSGFEVLKIKKTINYFSVRHIGRRALQVLGLSEFIARFLPKQMVPLPLGNIIVVAQKMG
jgi:hypothetical protein